MTERLRRLVFRQNVCGVSALDNTFAASRLSTKRTNREVSRRCPGSAAALNLVSALSQESSLAKYLANEQTHKQWNGRANDPTRDIVANFHYVDRSGCDVIPRMKCKFLKPCRGRSRGRSRAALVAALMAALVAALTAALVRAEGPWCFCPAWWALPSQQDLQITDSVRRSESVQFLLYVY